MRISDLQKNYKTTDAELELAISRDIAYQIGHDIEVARALREVSQRQLADLLGTKQSSISRIEKGTSLPSLSFLQKIARALDTYLIAPRFELVENFLKTTEDIKTPPLVFTTDSPSKDEWRILYPTNESGGNSIPHQKTLCSSI